MFYEDQQPDRALRQGDVVEGFVLGACHLESPSPDLAAYQISVTIPTYAAVLTPCCSVGERTLALAPLTPINAKWLDSPYLKEDLARMNAKMTARQAVDPRIWDRLSDEEKIRRQDPRHERALAYVEFFIYAPHDLLPCYPVRHKGRVLEMGYYAIDFRHLQRVECKEVVNARDVPLHAKVLQLSIESRNQLRMKLGQYFARGAPEDKP